MSQINVNNLPTAAQGEVPWITWLILLIATVIAAVTASWATLHVVGIDDRLVSYTLLEVLRILTRS